MKNCHMREERLAPWAVQSFAHPTKPFLLLSSPASSDSGAVERPWWGGRQQRTAGERTEHCPVVPTAGGRGEAEITTGSWD